MSFLLLPLMVFLNRFRGGGFYADLLPGHPRFYVSPVVGLASLLAVPWYQAAIIGAGYLLWCWPPWGMLMCLGRFVPNRKIDPIETSLLAAAGGNIWVALGLRHMLVAAPLFALVPFGAHVWLPALAIPFAALTVAAYETGWRLTPSAPIQTAELLVGGLWGLLILAV